MTRMTRMTHSGRRAVSLAEIVIAVGLVAVVSIPLFGLLAATDHEAMTSEDYMQAEALAQRRMADVLATPWPELEASLPLRQDLSGGLPADEPMAKAHEEFGRFLRQLQGELTVTRVEEGLISVRIELSWPVRPGSPARRRYGLLRLRARPDQSIRAAYAFGDGQGNR